MRGRTVGALALTLAIGLLLVGGAPIQEAAFGDTPAPAAAAAPGFGVSGNRIIGPTGATFVPHGANIGMANAFNARGTATGHAADIATWHWNVDRQTFFCLDRASYSTRLQDGFAQLMAGLNKIIAANTARKIVTIVTCFDPSSSVWGPGSNVVRLPAGSALLTTANRADEGKTYAQQFREFLVAVASQNRANPYVWIDPINEPTFTSVGTWQAFYSWAYAVIRGQGAANIITPEAFDRGSDTCAADPHLADADVGPAFLAGRSNVVFQVHAYGECVTKQRDPAPNAPDSAPDVYSALFARNATAGLPWFIGEFGYHMQYPAPQALNATTAVLRLGVGYGVGLVVWHATGNDGFTLKLDGGGFYDGGDYAGLSPLGRQVWSYNHLVP